MGQPARVLLVGDDSDDYPLSRNLRLCGWDCVTVSPASRPGDALEPTRPDIVILNLLSELGRRDPQGFVAFARALRAIPGGLRTPVMMVGERLPEHTACALAAAASAEVDDVVFRPVSEMQIAARVKALTRLKTMHEELVRRLQTTSRYGIDAPTGVPHPGPVEDIEALVISRGDVFGLLETALAKSSTLTGALTFDTALDYLDRRHFDILIVDATPDPSGAVEFCDRCRADARLYNTPIVLIAEPQTITESSAVFASGVTDLLERPVQPEELKVRVMALVREVRFRDTMRRVYREFRHIATGDALTGLYTRGFALEHLRGLIAAHKDSGSVFTAAYAEIVNIDEINTLYGYAVGDRVIRQVGELIGLLMRGEDLSARYKGAAFIVLLPDTPEAAANVALSRIVGVVNHTEFAIPEVSTPISVSLVARAREYAGGEPAEPFVRRLALPRRD